MGHHTGTDKPRTLDVRPENIPDEIKAIDQWVGWKWSWSKKMQKFKKPPFNPVTDNPSYTAPEGQSTFDRAVDRWRLDDKTDGVGFVLIGTPYIGLDVDGCVTERGQIDPRALELVDICNSYTDASPSFTGLHILIEGEFDGPDCFIDYKGLKVEIYRNRYMTMTGRRVKNMPAQIKNRQLVLDGLLARRQQPAPLMQLAGQAAGELAPTAATALAEQQDQRVDEQPARYSVPSLHGLNIPPKYRGGLSDDEVIRRARLQKGTGGAVFKRLFDDGDWRGYDSRSEAEMAFIGKLPFWVNADVEQADRVYRQSALFRLHRSKIWDEKRGNSTYGRDTIIKAIYNHYMEDFGYYGYARKAKREPKWPDSTNNTKSVERAAV